MPAHQELSEIHGLASIQNGHIQIQDPQFGGQPAQIEADESVLVFVNEVPIRGPVEVFSRTSIRVTLPLRTFPRYTLVLTQSPDFMQAWMRIEVHQPGVFYQLQDHPPTPHLKIRIQEKIAPLDAFEEIRKALLQTLDDAGIVYGIDQQALEQLLKNPEDTPVLVASGDSPVFVLDRFEDYFAFPAPPEGPESLFQKPFTLQYPVLKACKKGDILVRRIPGVVKQPGKNIRGEVVPAPNIHHPLHIIDGTVRWKEQGLVAVAATEGIPSFNGREVRIRRCYLIQEPVAGKRGGIIDLKGSIQIEADVLDQGQVWASQHIEVLGQVSHAQLEAEESIIIHNNTVKAQISAGGDTAASMRLIPAVEKLYQVLQQIEHVFLELKRTVPKLAMRPDKLILINLIKTQFPQLLSDAEKLWADLKQLKKLHPRKVMVLKVVLANLLNMEQKEVNAGIFSDWVLKLGDYLENLKSLDTLSSHVFLTYVQGSKITSQGNIYILGEGCYNSQLQARQHVLITGNPGYCREGRIEVGGNLIVRELGSPNASRLLVQLTPHGRVYAQLVYPGVELVFDAQLNRHIMEKLEWVEIYQERGEIAIKPLLSPET